MMQEYVKEYEWIRDLVESTEEIPERQPSLEYDKDLFLEYQNWIKNKKKIQKQLKSRMQEGNYTTEENSEKTLWQSKHWNLFIFWWKILVNKIIWNNINI